MEYSPKKVLATFCKVLNEPNIVFANQEVTGNYCLLQIGDIKIKLLHLLNRIISSIFIFCTLCMHVCMLLEIGSRDSTTEVHP